MAIVIGGRTVRRTITVEDPFGSHLLAAYLPGEGIVCRPMVVEKDKENEIVVAPKLLQRLDLRGKVVIGDAMHMQCQLSAQIVEAGGDFMWIVKDNRANTRHAIKQLFAPEKTLPGWECPAMDSKCAQTSEKQVVRIETRQITVSSLMKDYLDWPDMGPVYILGRRFITLATGEVETEVQYGLTRQKANTEKHLVIVRRMGY